MDKKSLMDLYKKLFRRTSFWRLREKAKNGKGLVGLLYTYNYYKYLDKKNSFIPLSADIANEPVFPHGIKGIFISSGAKIGNNAVIFHQVTVGSNTIKGSKGEGSPIIGNNVYIGAGAKIIGNVNVGDNARIGANCVVVNDIPENSTAVLEKPRIIIHEQRNNNEFSTYDSTKDI